MIKVRFDEIAEPEGRDNLDTSIDKAEANGKLYLRFNGDIIDIAKYRAGATHEQSLAFRAPGWDERKPLGWEQGYLPG